MDSRQTTIERPESAAHGWTPLKGDGEHKSSVEIERDIDRTRHDMDSTMDALGNRVHPKMLFDQVLDFFQQGDNREHARQAARDIGSRTVDALRDNPVPAMLIAAGVGWMVWNAQHRYAHYEHRYPSGERGQGIMERGQAAYSSTKERAAGAMETARDKVQSVAGTAQEKGREMKSDASQRAESYRSGLSQESQRLREGYRQRLETGESVFHDHPLAVGIAALAAGILAGLAFPSSSAERQLMGEKSRELREQATAGAREAKETVKETVRETAQASKSEAQRQGLTPEQLSEKARLASQQPGSPGEKAAREGLTPQQVGPKAGTVAQAAAAKIQEKNQDTTKP